MVCSFYLIKGILKLKINTLSMSTHNRDPYACGSHFNILVILQHSEKTCYVDWQIKT